jgi:hypothetical protein
MKPLKLELEKHREENGGEWREREREKTTEGINILFQF